MTEHKLVTIAITSRDFDKLIAHLHGTHDRESMAVAFFNYSDSPTRLKLLVREVRIPEESDYLHRSPALVSLQPEFLEGCFQYCEVNRCHFLDIHTHPWSTRPNFSNIDDSAARNTKIPYLQEYLPQTEIAFALFGHAPEALRARLWDNRIKKFRSIDRMVIL